MPPASPPIAPETHHHSTTKTAGSSMPTARLKRGLSPTSRDRNPTTASRLHNRIGGHQARGDEEAEVERGRRQQTTAAGRPAPISGVAEFAEPRASSGPLTSQPVSADRDEVQHQRRHDFVDAEPRAQQARHAAATRADDRRRGESEGMSSRRCARPGDCSPTTGRDEAAEIEAAFDADIENAGAERDARPRGPSAAAASPRSASPRCAARRRTPPRSSGRRRASGSWPAAARMTAPIATATSASGAAAAPPSPSGSAARRSCRPLPEHHAAERCGRSPPHGRFRRRSAR